MRPRISVKTGISRVQLGRGTNMGGRDGEEGMVGGYCIHGNIHSILLGRGSNMVRRGGKGCHIHDNIISA